MFEASEGKLNSSFVVTGGSGLIGSVITRRLIDLDHEVVVIDREPLPSSLADRVAEFHQIDITDDAACEAAVDDILASRPQINGVIACAGITRIAQFLDYSAEEWARVLDVNVTANVALIRRLVPTLVDSAAAGAGSDVVILGSVGSEAFFRGASVYGAGSSAQRTFTSHLRTEFASRGLRATSIDFGYVKSEAVDWHELYTADFDRLEENMMTPEDLSDTVMFVLSQPAGVQLHDITLISTEQGWV
nr:SDR family NAD(P)-dependent oxidoreductase [Brevibacterium sp. VCM10]